MNHRAKAILLVGLGVIVVMALFPPWVQWEPHWIDQPNSNAHQGRIYADDMGYGFLVGHPHAPGGRLQDAGINLPRLIAQWVIVAAVTAALTITTYGDKGRRPTSDQSELDRSGP